MIDIIIDNIMTWGIPVGIIFIGILAGWLFKRFIHQRLKKMTEKTEWRGDDVIFDAIESHIVLWFFLAAMNIASSSLSLSEDYSSYLTPNIILLK